MKTTLALLGLATCLCAPPLLAQPAFVAMGARPPVVVSASVQAPLSAPVPPPPPMRHEYRPPPPHPAAFWTSGYWAWSGAAYYWISGYWQLPWHHHHHRHHDDHFDGYYYGHGDRRP